MKVWKLLYSSCFGSTAILVCLPAPPLELDPRLDLTSDAFDALLALYSEHVDVPYPNAVPMDNLAIWHSRMFPKHKKEPPATTSTTVSTSTLARREQDQLPSSDITGGCMIKIRSGH